MLHYLRHRKSLGRSISSMLMVVWISLVLQPCVMAYTLPEQPAHPDCEPASSAAQEEANSADCASAMLSCETIAEPSCANLYNPDINKTADFALAQSQPMPSLLAVLSLETMLASAVLISPTAYLPHHASPPPLLRFCVQQV